MSLVKPILNPISAFNATSGMIVSFVASGGDEVTGNELKIVTNKPIALQIFNFFVR